MTDSPTLGAVQSHLAELAQLDLRIAGLTGIRDAAMARVAAELAEVTAQLDALTEVKKEKRDDLLQFMCDASILSYKDRVTGMTASLRMLPHVEITDEFALFDALSKRDMLSSCAKIVYNKPEIAKNVQSGDDLPGVFVSDRATLVVRKAETEKRHR